MNFLYVSCLCSRNIYMKLFNNSKAKPGQQVQKYHRLMAEGLAKNEGVKVKTITALPITRDTNSDLIVNLKDDHANNVYYKYLTIINLPILKNIFIIINSFFKTLMECIKVRDTVIICDVLNVSVTMGALIASKITKNKSVAIVTDIPIYLSNANNIKVKINNLLINSFDRYVLMTTNMNEVINKKNKPYTVIEGLVDINMTNKDNKIEKKYEKKVCIYAGGLQKIYGIKYLCEAFIKANVKNSELHIYGNGDFEDELRKLVIEHKNIKYFGVKNNEDVVEEQLKSVLLINPRPTNEEYTKYSFPSKNMEYMVSGTPILTTKLPGMPEEYYEYIYTINDETVDGLADDLSDLLNKSNEELYIKGKKAKEFVLKNKNNIIQAKKIIELITMEAVDG